GAAGGSSRLAGRSAAALATLVALTLVVGIVGLAAPRWARADRTLTRSDDSAPSRLAVTWLSEHANRNSRLLVDDTIWTDLVERGFQRQRTVWFYKLDLDPAVRLRWSRFDYVVRSNLL